MKLDCVLTSCNLNPFYCDFIPIFIKAWTKLYPTVDIKIILISDIIPSDLLAYEKYFILFKPIENMSTAFMSQYVRLLYPCILKYTNGVLITDMDMLPMNDKYYTENIKDIGDDKFVYYRHVCLDIKEIAMCYNTAVPATWRDVFDIHSENDVIDRLKKAYGKINYVDGHGASGWSTDQRDFYNYIMDWKDKESRFVVLNDADTGYRRLDRIYNYNHDVEKHKIRSGLYSDYHCFRPYKQYKQINDMIVDELVDNNFISGEKISSLCDVCIYEKSQLELYNNLEKHCKSIIYVDSIITDDIRTLINNSSYFFVNSSYIDYFQNVIMPFITKKFVLVTHNSDYTVGYHTKILSNPLLLKWFGQNMIPSEKTVGLPIGIENSQWKGSDYSTCVKNKNNKKENLLYVNFSFNTNKERKNIHRKLLENGFTENKKLCWEEYIKTLSTYKFCISPPGGGVDCHRHWESIYIGCIPVVLKDDILYKHFDDLPILYVDNYDNITKEYLNRQYEMLKNKKFSLEKTTLSYWKDEIKKL